LSGGESVVWRALALVIVVLASPGCGGGDGPREVPVGKARPSAAPADAAAATRPPRAIATH
jgi:hypothetical protein